jgi:hypothetical protein
VVCVCVCVCVLCVCCVCCVCVLCVCVCTIYSYIYIYIYVYIYIYISIYLFIYILYMFRLSIYLRALAVEFEAQFAALQEDTRCRHRRKRDGGRGPTGSTPLTVFIPLSFLTGATRCAFALGATESGSGGLSRSHSVYGEP